MNKKILIFISILFLSLNLVYAHTFQDVKENDWFYGYVQSTTNLGIFDKNDNFYPSRYVNRAELAKIAYFLHHNIQGYELPIEDVNYFTDIPENIWYEKYVNYGLFYNLFSGYSDSTFQPANNANRAETLRIILNASGIMCLDEYNHSFLDISYNDWFYIYFACAYENDIISGYPDGTFQPANNVNRAELSKILDNTIKLINQNDNTNINHNTNENFNTNVNDNVNNNVNENTNINSNLNGNLIDKSEVMDLYIVGDKIDNYYSGKFEIQAQYEDIKIKDLKFEKQSGNAEIRDIFEIILYDQYGNIIIKKEILNIDEIVFEDINFVIEKNAIYDFYYKLIFNGINMQNDGNATARSGKDIKYAPTYIKGIGQSSSRIIEKNNLKNDSIYKDTTVVGIKVNDIETLDINTSLTSGSNILGKLNFIVNESENRNLNNQKCKFELNKIIFDYTSNINNLNTAKVYLYWDSNKNNKFEGNIDIVNKIIVFEDINLNDISKTDILIVEMSNMSIEKHSYIRLKFSPNEEVNVNWSDGYNDFNGLRLKNNIIELPQLYN